jgi:hypothetical protein
MPPNPPSYDAAVAALLAQVPGSAVVPGELEAVLWQLDEAVGAAEDPERGALKLATRHLAQTLATRHPGRSVEVRVPPYAAVQCLAGVRHTRGTPPATVEVEPVAFVQLCTGRLGWQEAVRDGRVRASGERSDLSPLLPLVRLPPG